MSKKTLLIIAAIAVILAGATSAYGYYETWDGWFNSGYLILYDEYTFDYVEGQSTVEDITAGSVDSFVIRAILYRSFYCATTGYTIRLWVTTASGSKDTGQEGQKEVDDGEWSGMAILRRPPLHPDTFDVGGTWDTGDEEDDMYFDYPYHETPTYSAHWDALRSSPLGLTGKGGSAGDKQP